jgi:hypothetical protein
MKKIFLVIFLGIFLISLVSSFPICIDKTPPSPPSNLAVTSSGHNIILTWNAATDVPACSGIDYYVVSRDGNPISGHVNALTFTDINVPYGTYSYSVYAVDKVAHLGGQSIKNDVVLSAPSSGGGGGDTRVSGGGGAASYICDENWQCGSWSECVDGAQTRTCTDSEQCGTTINKPITSSTCSVEGETQLKQTTSFGNFLTGAVTGIGNFAKTGGGIATFGFLIITIAAGIVITIKRRRLKLKSLE